MSNKHQKKVQYVVCVIVTGVVLLFANTLYAQDLVNQDGQTNTNQNIDPNVTTVPATDPQPAVDISDLELQIKEQQAKIDELERKQRIYESNLASKRQESLSLKNQISLLDGQISGTDLEIQKIELQIELLTSEIERLQESIGVKSAEINMQKARLSELLRLLDRYHRKTNLEITLLNDTFSEFFQQLKYLQSVEVEAKRSLDTLAALKQDLEQEQTEQETKREEGQDRQRQLGIERENLTGQQEYREKLLGDTQQSEQQFEALLEQAKQEQLNANADVQNLEVQIRQRLATNGQLPTGPTAIIWPVTSRTVTAYFHDTSYPFRKYFEHPAIDIATPQGTPIRASASGFVARAKNAGLGYSYIMIVHGDGLSTVYGHISALAVVEEDFVVQGQVIGYSGGTPGTPGAGRLTTGPHLHFEVRLNGIPVDPMGYLN